MKTGKNIRFLVPSVFLALVFFYSSQLKALEYCQNAWSEEVRFSDGSTGDQVDWLFRAAILDLSAKQHGFAQNIRLERGVLAQKLFYPAAYIDENGHGVVLIDDKFLRPLCIFVVMDYIYNDDQIIGADVYSGAYQAVEDCGARQYSFLQCLSEFTETAARLIAPHYNNLDDKRKGLLNNFLSSALYQIIAHELAHIVLDHSNKIAEQKMLRIDAEFEADLAAIVSSLQTGRIHTALAYFFGPLSAFHQATGFQTSNHYESLECRNKNVADVAMVGGAALFFQSFATGEATTSNMNMREAMESILSTTGAADESRFEDVGCGRLKGETLLAIRQEIRTMGNFLVDNFELFRGIEPETEGVRMGVQFSSPNTIVAILDLIDQSPNLSPALSRTLSMYLQRATQMDEFEIDDQLEDRILRTAYDVGSSQTYGRTLAALAFRYIGPDGSPTNRDRAVDLFEEAVVFNPWISEAYVNLAMILFTDGKCEIARRHAARSYFTANEGFAKESSASVFNIINSRIEAQEAPCNL